MPIQRFDPEFDIAAAAAELDCLPMQVHHLHMYEEAVHATAQPFRRVQQLGADACALLCWRDRNQVQASGLEPWLQIREADNPIILFC